MHQTRKERIALADAAAYHSARISGASSDIHSKAFQIHLELMRSVMGSETRRIVHPAIYNSPLCGHPHEIRYRAGIRASARGIIIESDRVQEVFQNWWKLQTQLVAESLSLPEDLRANIAWRIHDFLISLEPFADANARTARLVFYDSCIAMNLPVKLITIEKANEYAENQRRFRRTVFMPMMKRDGYL